jgi:hypothetical protein
MINYNLNLLSQHLQLIPLPTRNPQPATRNRNRNRNRNPEIIQKSTIPFSL